MSVLEYRPKVDEHGNCKGEFILRDRYYHESFSIQKYAHILDGGFFSQVPQSPNNTWMGEKTALVRKMSNLKPRIAIEVQKKTSKIRDCLIEIHVKPEILDAIFKYANDAASIGNDVFRFSVKDIASRSGKDHKITSQSIAYLYAMGVIGKVQRKNRIVRNHWKTERRVSYRWKINLSCTPDTIKLCYETLKSKRITAKINGKITNTHMDKPYKYTWKNLKSAYDEIVASHFIEQGELGGRKKNAPTIKTHC